MAYDEYISLGVNCEVAFQFRRVIRDVTSQFFNWNVTRPKALLSLLESNFANVGEAANLVYENKGDLVRDTSHSYEFHWIGTDFSVVSDPETDAYKENALKLKYMAEKFNSLIKPDRRTAFFYNYSLSGDELTEDLEIFKSICDIIESRHNTTNYTLVLLMLDSLAERMATIKHDSRIVVRFMKRFAPWSDATDGHVLSWDNVFREFPHVRGLSLADY